MEKYTEKQKEDFKEYLGYGVKKGYLDHDRAMEIIENEKWEAVEEMIDIERDYIEEKICGEPRLVEDEGGGVILEE